MTELGPLEVILCWQSTLLAVIIYAITQSSKTAMYLWAGEDANKQKWVKGVALPLVPLALGALLAIVFPFKPPILVEWAIKGNHTLMYVFYGACVGQFADYLHQRINGVLKLKEPKEEPEA